MSVVGSSSRLDVQQAVPLARRQFSAARKDSLPIRIEQLENLQSSFEFLPFTEPP